MHRPVPPWLNVKLPEKIMRVLSTFLSIAAAASIASSPAAAQRVIDQNQPVTSWVYANLASGWAGQTFVQSGANLSGIGLFLQNYYDFYVATGPVEFRLFDRVPNGGNNPVLLESISQEVAIDHTGQWVDFFFDPIDVVPGQIFFFAVTGHGDVSFVQTHSGFKLDGSTYANGQGYQAKGTSDPTSPYDPIPESDLAFRTYTTLADPISTPEPASITLLATGLIGIAGVLRRRATRTSQLQ